VFSKHKFQQDKYNMMSDIIKNLHHNKSQQDQYFKTTK